MQCSCGAEMKALEHKVKTSLGANTWAEGEWSNQDLPLTIEQHICESCGRGGYKVRDKDKRLIKNHAL